MDELGASNVWEASHDQPRMEESAGMHECAFIEPREGRENLVTSFRATCYAVEQRATILLRLTSFTADEPAYS